MRSRAVFLFDFLEEGKQYLHYLLIYLSLHCDMQIRFNTEKNILCYCASESAPWSIGGSRKTSQGGRVVMPTQVSVTETLFLSPTYFLYKIFPYQKFLI